MLDLSIAWILIIVGIIMFVIEFMMPGQTFLVIVGAFFLTLGLVALWSQDEEFTFGAPGYSIAFTATIITAVFTIYLYRRLGRTQVPQTTVAESLIGRTGIVIKDIEPHTISGKVRIEQTDWSARADDDIKEGAHVEVVDSKGVHVVVEEIEPPKRTKKKSTKKKRTDFEIDDDDLVEED